MASTSTAFQAEHETERAREASTGICRDQQEAELGFVRASHKVGNPHKLGVHSCLQCAVLSWRPRKLLLLTLWHLNRPRTEPTEDIRQNVLLNFILGKPREYWEKAEEEELQSGS